MVGSLNGKDCTLHSVLLSALDNLVEILMKSLLEKYFLKCNNAILFGSLAMINK